MDGDRDTEGWVGAAEGMCVCVGGVTQRRACHTHLDAEILK